MNYSDNISPAVAKVRLWNPLHAEPAVRDVVLPMLSRHMPRDVAEAGPWTAARWAIDFVQTEGFLDAVRPFHVAAFGYNLSMSARRRYSMLAVPASVGVGMETWAERGSVDLQSPDHIKVAVEATRTLVSATREWMQKPASPLLVPNIAEAEGAIPLISLWMVAGAAAQHLVPVAQSDAKAQEALQRLVRATIAPLPERNARIWSRTEPVVIVDRGDRVFYGNWIGHGEFPLDPLENPKTQGAQWSQRFISEPLFLALGRAVEDIGRMASSLRGVLTRGPFAVQPDELGTLDNLGDRESAFSSAKFFSPSASFAPAGAQPTPQALIRAGQDPLSGLRLRALKAVFERWGQVMLSRGIAVNEAHLTKIATAARRFEQSSWQELSQQKDAPLIVHDAQLILSQKNPWGEVGRAMILAQLVPMLSVRMDTMRIVLGMTEEDASASFKDLRARWTKDKDFEKRMGELHALKLLHRLSPREPGEALAMSADDARNYWRRFLTGQPNPYCGLTEPENLIRGLTPLAYARRLRDVASAVWTPAEPDPIKAGALKEMLGVTVWREAHERVANAERSMGYEEAVLAGALAVAHAGKFDGFTPAHAYAVAFSVAMGSGGEPRLPDATKPSQDRRAKALTNAIALDELLLTGNAATVAQLVIDWQKTSKAHNAPVHRDERLRALAMELQAVHQTSLNEGGKPSLGSTLKDPAFWSKIVASPEALTQIAAKVASSARVTVSDAVSEVAGAYTGHHPLVASSFGRSLTALQSAGVNLIAMNLPQTPPPSVDLRWGAAVLASAVDEVSPMLDAFALGRVNQWMEPQPGQVTLVEAAGQQSLVPAPGKSPQNIYQQLLADTQRLYPQFRFGGEQGQVSTIAQATAVPRFMEAESKEHRSLLNLLTSTDHMLSPEDCRKAKQALERVFSPAANGNLGSNAQAVVWAAVLKTASDDFAGNPRLAAVVAATDGLLTLHKKVLSEVSRTAAGQPLNFHDKQYGVRGAEIAKALAQLGDLSPKDWWQIKSHVIAAVHANLQKQSRDIARSHLGPEAFAQARAAQVSAVMSGVKNVMHSADVFVKNPYLGRQLSLASPAGKEQPSRTPERSTGAALEVG